MSENAKLHRRIADLIADEILAGAYPVGSRLPTERELALRHGVSRATIHAAVVVLEGLQMVTARQGVGLVVTNDAAPELPLSDSEDGLLALYRARRLLESEIASLAAPLISVEQLSELDDLVVLMKSDDSQIARKAEEDFHLIMVEGAGNEALTVSVSNLFHWRDRFRQPRRVLDQAELLAGASRIEDHTLILQALRQRSGVAASRAVRRQIDNVIRCLVRAAEIVAIDQARLISRDRSLQLRARLSRAV